MTKSKTSVESILASYNIPPFNYIIIYAACVKQHPMLVSSHTLLSHCAN